MTYEYTQSIIYVYSKLSEVIIISPRTGRPKVENPINVHTSVRIDKETDDKLTEYCKKNGITKGEAVRRGILLLLSHK